MGLQELILKARKELVYLDEVVNDEVLIVLKLEQASPSKRILPEDIGGSGDARHLSISQQAFVARRAFLGNLRYSAALFSGSKEFLSLKTFFETAKYVLKNVRPLALVHTRKSIFKLSCIPQFHREAKAAACHFSADRQRRISTGDYIRSSFVVDVTMGLQELILEAIKDLGYLDEVVNDEDLVVLELEQASPSKRILAEDIGGSGDARRLSKSEKAFIACRAFFGNLRY
ncbi:hypothetical protein MRX96_058223 [Rhipicephalus microplus]